MLKDIALSYSLIDRNVFDHFKSGFSSQQNLPWSIQFIKEHMAIWDWKYLCNNPYITWDEELIETFEDNIIFEDLSGNKSVVWNLNLLNKYKDKWNAGNLISNSGLKLNIDVVNTLESFWFKPQTLLFCGPELMMKKDFVSEVFSDLNEEQVMEVLSFAIDKKAPKKW